MSNNVRLSWAFAAPTTLAITLSLLCGIASAGDQCMPAAELKPSAIVQIQALVTDKQRRTAAERKIDSSLLYALKRLRNDPLLAAVPALRMLSIEASDESVVVDIQANTDESLLARIDAIGGSVTHQSVGDRSIRANLPLAALEPLAALPNVRFIGPAQQMQTHAIRQPQSNGPDRVNGGMVTTRGDVAHTADQARLDFGVDGSGVMVCALSDSVDELAAIQAAGELPANVLVLPGQSGIPGTSEGTALLEIIHDMAPGASLGFATAGPTPAAMAQNILALRAAGCDVIMDDAFYITEPLFQDGIVAQAIDTVVAAGAVYIVAAGNLYNLDSGQSGVWEGLFAPAPLPPPFPNSTMIFAHDFGGVTFDTVTVDGSSERFPFTLKWANPGGQSGDDYDLYLVSPDMTQILDLSTSTQDGDDDALEILLRNINRMCSHVVVVKFSGDDVYFQFNTFGSLLTLGTDRLINGHSASASALSIGAVDVNTALGGPFLGGSANPPEAISSDGFRRVFFDTDGNPLGARGVGGVVRLKPELMAANQVSTTSSNWLTFSGTSASAPHVAAMVALYLQRFPQATPDQVRQAFMSTALDIGTPGFDRTAGAGIAMARAALLGDFRFADSFEDPMP